MLFVLPNMLLVKMTHYALLFAHYASIFLTFVINVSPQVATSIVPPRTIYCIKCVLGSTLYGCENTIIVAESSIGE